MSSKLFRPPRMYKHEIFLAAHIRFVLCPGKLFCVFVYVCLEGVYFYCTRWACWFLLGCLLKPIIFGFLFLQCLECVTGFGPHALVSDMFFSFFFQPFKITVNLYLGHLRNHRTGYSSKVKTNRRNNCCIWMERLGMMKVWCFMREMIKMLFLRKNSRIMKIILSCWCQIL